MTETERTIYDLKAKLAIERYLLGQSATYCFLHEGRLGDMSNLHGQCEYLIILDDQDRINRLYHYPPSHVFSESRDFSAIASILMGKPASPSLPLDLRNDMELEKWSSQFAAHEPAEDTRREI